MSEPNEQHILFPFDSMAKEYENEFDENLVKKRLRSIIWGQALRKFKPGNHILEINCGTGTDAIHFTQHGIRVTGIDASLEMIEAARRKAERYNISTGMLNFQQLRTEDMNSFQGVLYDGLFSNFDGLNCVADLPGVFQSFIPLLKPKSHIIICLLNKIYPWEILSFLLRGNLNGAFRRLQGGGTEASLGSSRIHVWYYSEKQLKTMLSPSFSINRIFGLSILSPNPNSRFIIAQYPSLTNALMSIDEKLSSLPMVRSLGDHIVITAQLTV